MEWRVVQSEQVVERLLIQFIKNSLFFIGQYLMDYLNTATRHITFIPVSYSKD